MRVCGNRVKITEKWGDWTSFEVAGSSSYPNSPCRDLTVVHFFKFVKQVTCSLSCLFISFLKSRNLWLIFIINFTFAFSNHIFSKWVDSCYELFWLFLILSTSHRVTLYRASDISRKKNAKFRGIFRGKFAEKSADFAGFSRKKSQNSQKNRPISRDFSGKKSNFEGFSGQILRQIGWFHGKFRGETSPRNNQ